MLRCPRCGELVTGDRRTCIGCGREVEDPTRAVDRRLRGLLIGGFVLGGLVVLARYVRDAVSGG